MTTHDDRSFMRQALDLARQAASAGEVPIGAVLVHKNTVISYSYNLRESLPSALAHAEITVLEQACARLRRWRLSGCTLYVTLEPCVMCAGAIVQARVERVVYGAKDPKGGAVESLYQVLSDARLNHRPEVIGGVLAEECSKILTDFFRKRRNADSIAASRCRPPNGGFASAGASRVAPERCRRR